MPDRDFAPSGFFVFRTPLLPFEEIEAWSASLTGDWVADRELLRSRLRAIVERPEVLEALFLASPSLVDGLAAWRLDPEGKKGQRAERALVRYFLRMASRATPFGLFSGCSLGEVRPAPEAATRLAIGPRAASRRRTRLDMDYLFALCEDLRRDGKLRAELAYRPNSSLYRAAGRLRYAEARLAGKVRSHHLVAVESSPYVEAALACAGASPTGASAAETTAAVAAADPDGEVSAAEAAEFVTELIDSQLLVSDLAPPVTGSDPLSDVQGQLAAAAAPLAVLAAERLAVARDTLAALDAGGIGAPPARYSVLAGQLAALPTPVELSRLFQVDLIKPAHGAALGGEVLVEICRGVELLRRLTGRPDKDTFERFRKDFAERYGEGREMPLPQVLDEEIGIGFERSEGAAAEASPLLKGLPLAPAARAAAPKVSWEARQDVLLALLDEALAAGAAAIDLSDEDLDRLAPPPSPGAAGPPPLPDAFQVMAVLAAASPEAIERGEFQLFLEGAAGPSGARLLGRFCDADEDLRRRVEEHLRAEEALAPEALFAEVVHLPQGRVGNVLFRPLLRAWEIPFLGRSGAPPERQIPVTDLRVSIATGRIVLRSERLGRELVPRLTSAHNFSFGSLGLYRFLGMLQSQGTLGALGWSWGPLDSAPFLPRVTAGRLVLARAAWWMTKEEIGRLAKAPGAARFAAVQEWRRGRRLPRLVALADADNHLFVDLDNALAVETFVELVRSRDRARLYEVFPGPAELCARGPEGRFVHELVVPFVRTAAAGANRSAEPAAAGAVSAPGMRRSFPPGSEWLYAKLYVGTSTADRLLREAIAPVVREALRSGAADGWFFLRYGDPEWHLRLRLHGEPAALLSRTLPALRSAAGPFLADGGLWRLQLDTYEREIERYGGPQGIALAERLFEVDSRAVLDILEMLEGDEGADVRWRLALRGADMLLADCGLDADARRAGLKSLREAFAREFGGAKELRVELDRKFRAERKSLEALLDPANDAASSLAPALAVLDRRRRELAPVIAELQRLQAAGRLTATVAEMASSFVHLHVNRMIRSSQRAHELAIYDLLYQLYESRAARERGTARGA